jgi:hypothetical protein
LVIFAQESLLLRLSKIESNSQFAWVGKLVCTNTGRIYSEKRMGGVKKDIVRNKMMVL